MKPLILTLLGLFYFPISYFTSNIESLNYQDFEVIDLEGNFVRQQILIDDQQELLQICNLTEGDEYAFTILPQDGCQPLIDEVFDFTFKAEGECKDLIISSENCQGYFWISVRSTNAFDSQVESSSLLQGINVATGNPEDIIRDIFIGSTCVEVTNVTITGGNPNGFGSFTNGGSSIGISEGIIITSGSINNAPGPNNTTEATATNDDLIGDADLESLLPAGSIVRDYTFIEFDFVPTQTSMSFRYVFASEEYCDFVESEFNDVFGFFISGPSVPGGTQNIAVLPGGSTAVAINNVNFGENESYFIDNTPINQPQFPLSTGCFYGELANAPATDDTQFDGFTVVLTATANGLIPCTTYHIKLAVSDVGDAILDSAVFLEANSFDAGGDVDLASNSPICEKGTIEIIADPSSCSNTGFSYQWSGPNGPIANNSATLTINNASILNDEGVYFVTVTDIDGCTASEDIFVNIVPNPGADAANNGPICQGETLELFAQAAGGSPDYTYMWTGPNLASNEQNPVIVNAQPDDSGVYEVKVTDQNGCMDVAQTIVTVHENPTVTASSNSPICAGDTLRLFAVPSGVNPGFTYKWSGPDGFMSNDQNPTISGATTAADGVYTVIVTDSEGCVGMNAVDVTVYPTPTISATSNSPICIGDHLFLESEPMGGTPPYTFEWDRLTGSNALKQNPKVFDTTIDDAGDYTVTVTDINGCKAEATTTVIMWENIDDPGKIEGDEYFCGPGFNPSIINSIEPASGAFPIEYFWMKTTENMNYWEVIPGATGLTYDPPVIYETTIYSRCARRVGCQKALESNFVSKTVGTEAQAYISGPNSTCVGITTIYSAPVQQGATYSWDFGPGATPGYANSPSVAVSWSTMGVRTIKLKVSTPSCTANNLLPVFVSNHPVYCDMGMIPEVETDIEKDEENTLLEPEIFPNPFKNEVVLLLNQGVRSPIGWSVSNLQGKGLFSGVIAPGETQVTLNLSELPAGMYLLSVNYGEIGVVLKKIVKE